MQRTGCSLVARCSTQASSLSHTARNSSSQPTFKHIATNCIHSNPFTAVPRSPRTLMTLHLTNCPDRSGQCRFPGPYAVRSVGHSVKTMARYEQTCGVDDFIGSPPQNTLVANTTLFRRSKLALGAPAAHNRKRKKKKEKQKNAIFFFGSMMFSKLQ